MTTSQDARQALEAIQRGTIRKWDAASVTEVGDALATLTRFIEEAEAANVSPLPAEVAKIEERLAKISQGPWMIAPKSSEYTLYAAPKEWAAVDAAGHTIGMIYRYATPKGAWEQSRDDADFIAHAPDDIRALLELVRMLEAMRLAKS